MDAFLTAREVVFMKSAQVGATEALLNILAWIMDQDPGPTLVVYPTIEMGKAWSKDRLDPMLRDTPLLRNAVTDNQKDAGNTILHKRFPGGAVTVVGANSEANLRSRPIRNVLLDEIDGYPKHIDGVGLAIGRAKAFGSSRRIYKASTPLLKDSSRIERAFGASNMQYYFVPCPHCDAYQRLIWEQVRWQKELPGGRRVPGLDKQWKGRGRHLPETACYVCEHCGAELSHDAKARMLARGEWRATAQETGVEGFHINEIYSPFVTWQEMVEGWLVKKQLPETLQEFVNQSLGLSWEEQADKHDPQSLKSRAEPYRQAPNDTLLVTCSVDVQDDRLELEACGWGRMFESWSLDWKQFLGDPAFPDVWRELDEYLRRTFERGDGVQLPITCTMVDSGHHTDMVYRFCKARYRRRVYALKGVGGLGSGHPIVGRIKRENKFRCPVLPANVDECKNRIFGWLSLEEAGPGYMHFPDDRDDEYFYQLTAEDRVERVLKGQKVRAYVQRRARNEALDLRVYNLVAVELLAPKWDTLARRQAPKDAEPVPVAEVARIAPPLRPILRRQIHRPGGFTTNW
jgi:phage terminase large subunit GpA-like protein